MKKSIIDYDLYRYTGKISFINSIKLYILNPGFRYIYILRKCQKYLNNKKIRIFYYIYRLLLLRYRYKYGIDIPVKTKIGKGFFINHIGGIVVNPNVEFGDNVNITNGVTIGVITKGNKKGVPTIGNSVFIGANAVIVGNINVGNNVLIAPNSYVNFDVPDNSIVIGNPGKIHFSADATGLYVNNKI